MRVVDDDARGDAGHRTQVRQVALERHHRGLLGELARVRPDDRGRPFGQGEGVLELRTDGEQWLAGPDGEAQWLR